MKKTIVDVSVLQTVPPSCINRDDTGSPKTATYGGTIRARVSSQAQKHAVRSSFSEYASEGLRGVRTKRVVDAVVSAIQLRDSSIAVERAQELATAAFGAAGISVKKPKRKSDDKSSGAETDYLFFLSRLQVTRVAEICVACNDSADLKSALKDAGVKRALGQENSVDLALFGRMVADVSDLNVDASCQVAHALSIHEVENEFDYFTAVDDVKREQVDEDAGAAMIGTVEFNSATLYRYATVDVNALQRNLGDNEAARVAVEAFTRAFITSMPTGKQNTFANRTLPDAVLINVREVQSVNLVGAFETAIRGPERVRQGCERLSELASEIDAAYGTTPVRSWVVRVGAQTEALGDRTSLDDAITQLGALVLERAESDS